MSEKRSTPFQPAHCLEYGLSITGRDLGRAVSSVQCDFCVYLGRTGEDVGRKRSRTQNIQLFAPPFRPELYRKHLQKQHGDEWLEYQSLSKEMKKTYFKKEVTIHRFLCSSSDAIEFKIASRIADELVAILFFHPDDDAEDGDPSPMSKANAMKLFRLDEGGANYTVLIKNSLRFWLAIDHISVGLSFRQTAAVIEQHRVRTKNPKLVGLNDHMVSQFARILVGANLQMISDILSAPHVFAFSIAGDGSTHFESAYFDIRIRVGVNGFLYNLHLVIVPFFGRHTALNICQLIVKILDVLFPMWRDKLISISTDGENTMTGRHGGLVTLLDKEATNSLLRVWCAAHQMDLVVKQVTKTANDGLFYKKAHALSVYLRAQLNLIADMGGSKCPKDTTRWVAFGKLIKWNLQHRRRLLEFIEEKRPVQAPEPAWWIMCAGVAPLFEALQFTFASLQAKELVISQQAAEIDLLVGQLCIGIGICHASSDVSFEQLQQNQYIKVGEWWVTINAVKIQIEDQGLWARDLFAALSNTDQESLVSDIAVFWLEMVNGLQDVRAERDARNESSMQDAPPVYPAQLCRIRASVFNATVLDPRRAQLGKFWSPTEIEEIEIDHRKLCKAYADEDCIKKAIDAHDHTVMFNDAWDSMNGRFHALRCFSSGLC